ncbi:MAG: hypothetical protein HY778_03945 [Betaproteobacteria bacterium]|nr:hypothetical protein [Betaproteobacteria bacterium]
MGRILFWLLLAFLIWLLFTWTRRSVGRPPDGQAPKERQIERMVSCAHCGVHIPENESVRAGERHFCSEEHRRLGG